MTAPADSVVLIEPYYLPISHTMGYFQRILKGLRDASRPVEGLVVTDGTTSTDAAAQLHFAVRRMPAFRRSAMLRRLGMFVAALWTAVRGISNPKRKTLVLLAYEPMFLWMVRP